MARHPLLTALLITAGVATLFTAPGCDNSAAPPKAAQIGARRAPEREANARSSDPLFVLNQRINRLARSDRHADARAADGAWDCEDYAFAKRDALKAEGVYSEVWRVRDSTTTAHAAVRIPAAPGVYSPLDRVMDNRFDGLTTVRDAEAFQRYVFVRPMVSVGDQYATPPEDAPREVWTLYWRDRFAAADQQQLAANTAGR